MNYKRIYNEIIERAKTRETVGYKERHHIIPESLGGSDDKDNLVDLTAREHFLCHYLLTKIYEKETVEYYKMLNAFIMMKCSNELQDRYINSHLYESKKIEFSKMQSVKQSGEGNSQHGTMWIHNLDLKKSRKIKKDEFSDWQMKGWLKGRKLKFDKPTHKKLSEQEKILNKEKRKAETIRKNELKKAKKLEELKRKKEEKKKQNVKKYTELYRIYNDVGFKKFVEITNYEYTLESLVYQFNIYVDEFEPQSRKKRGK